MPPEFRGYKFTGPLRPNVRTKMDQVPNSIPKPDYALTGRSAEEERMSSSGIQYLTDKDIKGVRAACRVGREVLDVAGDAVRVGITTEEINNVYDFLKWQLLIVKF